MAKKVIERCTEPVEV